MSSAIVFPRFLASEQSASAISRIWSFLGTESLQSRLGLCSGGLFIEVEFGLCNGSALIDNLSPGEVGKLF